MTRLNSGGQRSRSRQASHIDTGASKSHLLVLSRCFQSADETGMCSLVFCHWRSSTPGEVLCRLVIRSEQLVSVWWPLLPIGWLKKADVLRWLQHVPLVDRLAWLYTAYPFYRSIWYVMVVVVVIACVYKPCVTNHWIEIFSAEWSCWRPPYSLVCGQLLMM